TAPILVAAPLYFTGKTSFGGMMMAAAAFTQAQGSLRWFVDNFSAIADWRASLLRVANFRAALVATESHQAAGSRIEYAEGPAGAMVFEDLQVESPVGREGFHERRVVIRAREHTLICGAPGDAVPGNIGALALGQRAHRPATGRIRDVCAARHALPAARHAARSARLPAHDRPLRRSRLSGSTRTHRPRAVRIEPRRAAALG